MATPQSQSNRAPIFPPTDRDRVWQCKVCGLDVRFTYSKQSFVEIVDAVSGDLHSTRCNHPHRSPHGRLARCGTCEAPILWAVTTAGKRMPVDAAMVDGGNIVLAPGKKAGELAALVVPAAARAFVSHFATCAQAAQHRRQRAEAEAETHVGMPAGWVRYACGNCPTVIEAEPGTYYRVCPECDHAMQIEVPDAPAEPCDFAPMTRDVDAGKAAATDGAERAYAAADLDWKVAAMMAVRQIARERHEFTTDDVWERIPAVREPRALGAVMTKAARAGTIQKSDRVRDSARPEAHSRPVAVWLSLTYLGDTTCP